MRRIVPFLPIIALLLPGEAFAHAHLKSSSPVDGGVLTTGAKEIILTFGALINEAMCSAVDASGAKAAADAIRIKEARSQVANLTPITGMLV